MVYPCCLIAEADYNTCVMMEVLRLAVTLTPWKSAYVHWLFSSCWYERTSSILYLLLLIWQWGLPWIGAASAAWCDAKYPCFTFTVGDGLSLVFSASTSAQKLRIYEPPSYSLIEKQSCCSSIGHTPVIFLQKRGITFVLLVHKGGESTVTDTWS